MGILLFCPSNTNWREGKGFSLTCSQGNIDICEPKDVRMFNNLNHPVSKVETLTLDYGATFHVMGFI